MGWQQGEIVVFWGTGSKSGLAKKVQFAMCKLLANSSLSDHVLSV